MSLPYYSDEYKLAISEWCGLPVDELNVADAISYKAHFWHLWSDNQLVLTCRNVEKAKSLAVGPHVIRVGKIVRAKEKEYLVLLKLTCPEGFA